jgi:hypothetical protein
MRKTEAKLNKLLRMFKEADGDLPPGDEGPPEGAPQDAPPEPPKEKPPAQKMSQNEKEIIDLLARAFIFNPEDFPEKRNQIDSAIANISTSVNVPIPTIVDAIEDVVSLNVNLRKKSGVGKLINNLESRAIKLFKGIKLLSEELKDATEPQVDDKVTKEVPESPEQEAQQPDNSEFKLDLQEIFPMYRALIAKALRHSPTEDEIINLQAVVDEFTDVDPKKIVTTIKNMLSQSLEDKEVEQDLANV